ncbi:hypothetical protein BH23PAT2_BH23PAT2_01150 [soil metagenome]
MSLFESRPSLERGPSGELQARAEMIDRACRNVADALQMSTDTAPAPGIGTVITPEVAPDISGIGHTESTPDNVTNLRAFASSSAQSIEAAQQRIVDVQEAA